MLRIDENTYIDDTLVTCAEYQLFIDEMREQGKYYQPDHWRSYTFPTGQARQSILGIRHSDASAFCKWITERQGGEWGFRLPTSAEAKDYPMKLAVKSPLGYWTNGKTGDIQFAWVDCVPANPRAIDRDRVINHARNRALAISRSGDVRGFSTDINEIYVPDIKIEHALNCAYHLDLDSDLNRDRAQNRININYALDRSHDRAIARARDRAIDNAHYSTSSAYYSNNLLGVNRPDVDIDFILDTYVDLFTLQERIAGRSPAFEGIRLIKERK